jgi:predicted metal-dependent phosphoesterase TrpH
LDDKKIIPGEGWQPGRRSFICNIYSKGLAPEETASAIKEQGRAVYLPHPWKQGGSHLGPRKVFKQSFLWWMSWKYTMVDCWIKKLTVWPIKWLLRLEF